MKRYLLALVAILLFTTSALASGIYQPVARGTVAQADMKISAVDGTAFVDFSAADVLTLKLGTLLKIRDSAGRLIQGYPKAVGTGETLGAELLEDIGFADDTKWLGDVGGTGWSVAGGVASRGGAATVTSVYQELRKTVNGLYKYSFDLVSRTAGSVNLFELYVAQGKTIPATYAGYITATNTSFLITGNYFNGTVDNVTLKQVLTPSTTGVTISSTKGGSTMNWATKDASFNYNDASGYTYEIYRVLTAPVIATNDVTAGNALIDATDANAFAAPIGVDLSPYQDGRHILAMYDASGYAALAWISATAPSGEALGDELIGNTVFSDTSWWTSIDANWLISGGVAISNGTGNIINSGSILTANGLYKQAIDIVSLTSGTVTLPYSGAYASAQNSSGTKTAYHTAKYSPLYIAANSFVGSIDNPSIKRLTMPAATGALLLSTKGGSRGFIYKHPSFSPNAAITAKILFVGD